jgi:hypothetical protein
MMMMMMMRFLLRPTPESIVVLGRKYSLAGTQASEPDG